MNRPDSGRRTGLHRLRKRWPLLAGIWGLATAIGLLVAATTAIGPVIISFSRNHGVHIGDVSAFAFVYGLALMTTAWIANDE